MKTYLIPAFSLLVLFSCGKSNRAETGQKELAETAVHSHETHNHETHNHETHNHEGHNHEGHNHEGHNHEGHNHEGHNHEGHNHEGHDHEAHTHAPGEECTHDHSSADSHAGHDSHEGHSHAAEPADPHAGHDHGETGENPDEIVFPASQAAKTDFKVEQVVPSAFTEVIKTSGQIIAIQETTVSAPVSGIVSFARANLSEGNSVSKSQDVFYISSKNIASGDQAAKSAAVFQKAKADYERAQALLDDKIVSQREFEAITAEYIQAKSDYEALAGAQSGRGTRVSPSMPGYVTAIYVSEGDFVEVGQSLAKISQNRRLTLRAEVSQRYFGKLSTVNGANFIVPYENATYKLSDMGGRLISVGQSAAAGASLIPVTFEFNNNGSVVPGSYVEVYLLGTPVANVISLPVTAITEQQGLYYVYTQLDSECYERREVALGGSDGERVRIMSGLRPGERVVTRGAVNVKLAAASGSIPHGHEH